MRKSRMLRALVGLVCGSWLVLVPAAPANAFTPDSFYLCDGWHAGSDCDADAGRASGTITWGNRTAVISGQVWDTDANGMDFTTAFFEAYAGSTEIDSTTRTANRNSPSFGSPRPYTFVIGNPDLVGGINRIKITVCWVNTSLEAYYCTTPPVNFMRD